jgi:hypothetical protein
MAEKLKGGRRAIGGKCGYTRWTHTLKCGQVSDTKGVGYILGYIALPVGYVAE